MTDWQDRNGLTMEQWDHCLDGEAEVELQNARLPTAPDKSLNVTAPCRERTHELQRFSPNEPYATRATIHNGPSGAKYTVLEGMVDQYFGLKEKRNPNDYIILDTVDERIDHSLIHSIYTGRYQIPPSFRIAA